MIQKGKVLSVCALAASLLLLLIGVCGLIFKRYPTPSILSEYWVGVTEGDVSLLLSVLTLLMSAVLATPQLIKLMGIKVHHSRRLYLAIQCCIAVAFVFILIETQTSSSQYPVNTAFVQSFQDLNRSGDDDVAGVAFDSKLHMLVVGRESGRVEFWNTYSPGTRFVHEAHMARAEFIAFGQEDGIVLTGSPFDNDKLQPGSGPHIWDAVTGELLVVLSGFWAPGPMVASPIKGLYVIADSDSLRLYYHRQRKLVGDTYTLESDAQVTAIASDEKSGLIAVGSSSGELQLLRLNIEADQPYFKRVRQIAPYGKEMRLDVLTLKSLQEGKRLVSVGWLPEALREHSQAEISEWDTDTFQRQRTYPFSLQTINWAAAVPNEPWLILAGLESSRGKIELMNLQTGIAWRYKANTSHPRAVLLPPVNTGLILQSGRATQINYLDE